MMASFESRLRQLARDAVVDVEDVDHALQAALADGTITEGERELFRSAALLFSGMLEPAAAGFLSAWAGGARPALPNRVLLAPHPTGTQPDLFYARRDVVALQESLTGLGHPCTVDGDFGPGTLRAVQQAQAAAGLPTTGVLDSITLRALNDRLAGRGLPPLDVSPRDLIRPDAVLALRGGQDRAANLAVETALNRLAAHFRQPGWKCDALGAFDRSTERALAAFQAAAYLPATGIFDGATQTALNLALRAAGATPLALTPPARHPSGDVELHFYPGELERKVYVLRAGQILDRYAMVGGARHPRPDPQNPSVGYSPTAAGTYEIVEVSPHSSQSWAYSYVPYGAPLREADGEIQFRDDRGRWQHATGPLGLFRGRTPPPLPASAYRHEDGSVMPAWQLNDFGHLRARLRSLRTGTLQTHMIHASPRNELTPRYFADTRGWLDAAVALAELDYSHGCEHIHPRDLDLLVARGYLRLGTRFVVHGYDERAPSSPVNT